MVLHGGDGPFKNYAYLILVLSFTLVLWIEKIATSEDDHHHHHHGEGVSLVEHMNDEENKKYLVENADIHN